jgi:hypothetical protein
MNHSCLAYAIGCRISGYDRFGNFGRTNSVFIFGRAVQAIVAFTLVKEYCLLPKNGKGVKEFIRITPATTPVNRYFPIVF